jgi:hypothetical protein
MSTSLPLIALLLALLSRSESSGLAYPVLSISVVPLFLSLISSTAPSLCHLYPSSALLPISTYTSTLLRRIAKPSLLFLPLAGALFVALACSLNGDIWRLGVQLPTEPPGEIGVAPFAVRMWLAIALAVVLAGWVIVGCSRCVGAALEDETTAIEVTGPMSDPWAAEWGRAAASRARTARARALRQYLIVPVEVPESSASATSDSESQPLIAPPSSSSLAVSSTRRLFAPIIPLPTPLNILILILGTLPALVIGRLSTSDPGHRAGQAMRWKLAVERWVWRAVALVTALWLWDWISHTRLRGRVR